MHIFLIKTKYFYISIEYFIFEKVLSIGAGPGEEHKHQCVMCQKAVNIPKSHKKKIDEKKEEKEARQNGERRNGHDDGGKDAWKNGGQSGGKKHRVKHNDGKMEAGQNGRGSSGNDIRLKHDDDGDLNEGIRMKLCGCLFCKECFEFVISQKLDQQRGIQIIKLFFPRISFLYSKESAI